jgi:hypothetical protein
MATARIGALMGQVRMRRRRCDAAVAKERLGVPLPTPPLLNIVTEPRGNGTLPQVAVRGNNPSHYLNSRMSVLPKRVARSSLFPPLRLIGPRSTSVLPAISGLGRMQGRRALKPGGSDAFTRVYSRYLGINAGSLGSPRLNNLELQKCSVSHSATARNSAPTSAAIC